jgi:hypothetical protein
VTPDPRIVSDVIFKIRGEVIKRRYGCFRPEVYPGEEVSLKKLLTQAQFATTGVGKYHISQQVTEEIKVLVGNDDTSSNRIDDVTANHLIDNKSNQFVIDPTERPVFRGRGASRPSSDRQPINRNGKIVLDPSRHIFVQLSKVGFLKFSF